MRGKEVSREEEERPAIPGETKRKHLAIPPGGSGVIENEPMSLNLPCVHFGIGYIVACM